MTNKEILNNIVLGMNKGYYCGERTRNKIEPLHSTMNNLILENLGNGYEGHGYGMVDQSEYTLRTDTNSKWRPDGFFHREVSDISLTQPKGGALDYKAPYSNFWQNNQNAIKALSGEATKVRPYGNIFGAFIMVQDRAPYFDKEGKFVKLENFSKNVVSEWEKWALTNNSIDGAPDIVGVCIYHLNGFDYSKVFDKEDYANELNEFNGTVDFVEVEGVTSTDRFVFNNPNLFAENFSKMLKNRFGGTEKSKSFFELFLETPISEQEKYLVEHGKLSYVPSYIMKNGTL